MLPCSLGFAIKKDLVGGDVTPGTVRSLPGNLDLDDQSSFPGEVSCQQSASSSSNVNLNNLDGVFFDQGLHMVRRFIIATRGNVDT